MRNKNLALALTLGAVFLGFLISLQMQTHKNVTALEKIQAQRTESVKALLTAAQDENAALIAEHKKLTEQLAQAQKSGGASPELLAELDHYRLMDGTMDVQGPGIQIQIDDRQRDQKVVFPLSPDDLLRISNTLKFAGAEVVSINGQRLVGTTAIVLSGSSTKLVNQVPINREEGVPYEILAIGNQDQLLDYFTNLEATALKKEGITISVTRKIVKIPSYKGVYSIQGSN